MKIKELWNKLNYKGGFSNPLIRIMAIIGIVIINNRVLKVYDHYDFIVGTTIVIVVTFIVYVFVSLILGICIKIFRKLDTNKIPQK